ncbi:MAG: DEAD/DEAH box helicase [Gemmatimonadota bacterium]
MALNPIVFTERVVRSFLRYQLTAYPFADERLLTQMRTLLSLDETRDSPLLRGPFISLSRPFRTGASVDALVKEGVFHAHMRQRIPAEITNLYGHQEDAVRAIRASKATLVSTGTGSGKTECFLYPVVSRCLELRDAGEPSGISAVLVYPMNALAEDQLTRLRGLLAGTGISFGMYVGKTPENERDVAGVRLPAGSSRADYEAAVDRMRSENRGDTVFPAEELCSREIMRTPGRQPRILLTNVKQLELLLTRQRDVELFEGARLDYLVFDEAHTFTGAQGAETACLIRRLRRFVGRTASATTCIATSATIVDRERPNAAREFASRFFGIPGDDVVTIGEAYEPAVWASGRRVPPAPKEDPAVLLEAVVKAVDDPKDAGAAVATAYARLAGEALPGGEWTGALNTALGLNELVFRIEEALVSPCKLGDLPAILEAHVGRAVSEAEILAWLALGAAARGNGRPLLRPVVHGFVRGISGAVVSFPSGPDPKLWLAAEDEAERHPEGEQPQAHFPVTTCNTCGQHYFISFLKDFRFVKKAPEGGSAEGALSVWEPLAEAQGGTRLVLVDHIVGNEEDDDDGLEKTAPLHICRSCGAAHPATGQHCLHCGSPAPFVVLNVVRQKEDNPGYLSSCLSCGTGGRRNGTLYREPARPVRATNVADVHVLAQDILHHAERKRLLVFCDNRQEAAFQAGWMKDHARRFRLRALIAEGLAARHKSIGDVTLYLDDRLEQDVALSRALAPEVWEVVRREGSGGRHEQERRKFLRIQVLREVTLSSKQSLGLEPWGRMKVEYEGLDSSWPWIQQYSKTLRVPPDTLRDGVAVLLDMMRRKRVLYDPEREIFTKYWMDGDQEVQAGYLSIIGAPQGTKLTRAPQEKAGYVLQWLSDRGDTAIRMIARSWGVLPDDMQPFLETLFDALKSRGLLRAVTLKGSRGNALPGVSSVYQIDADRLRLLPSHGVYRCRSCRRRSTRTTPKGRCAGWRCEGVLEFIPEDPDNYDLQLLDQGYTLVRPEEHTAMVPHEERERLENLFKGDSESVNAFICTPTLELGVDIGQLDSILMRNVPPLPANYWQRAGRAGRRHRMAVNLTYCRSVSHDRAYFSDPLKLLSGRVDPPSFNLRNPVMVAKHIHAAMITRLHQYCRDTNRTPAERQQITGVLDACIPPQVGTYLFLDGAVRTTPFSLAPLAALVAANRSDLEAYVGDVFSGGWPAADAEVVSPAVLSACVDSMVAELEATIQRVRRRLRWAMDQIKRLNLIRENDGDLDPEEESLFRRCDALVKRFKGTARRSRREAEGYDDSNTYGLLAAEGFLPGYGLETGSVLGTAEIPFYRQGALQFALPRPAAVALREYVPGNLIYANGNRFVARRFHRDVDEQRVEMPTFEVSTGRQAVHPTTMTAATSGLGTTVLQTIAVCDVDLMHQSHISDEEELRFQLGVTIFGLELGQHGGGEAYAWGAQPIHHRRSVRFRQVNVGASIAITKYDRLGYPICTVCGQSVSPLSSEKQRLDFSEKHKERCGRAIEPVGFYSDIVADAISLAGCPDQETAYSVLEALRMAATQVLDMHNEDLQILVIGHVDRDSVDAFLWDPMPGGSGLLDQFLARFPDVIKVALDICGQCPGVCDTSCVDCLQTFRNGFYHKYLDRHRVLERLGAWGSTIASTHAIIAVQQQMSTTPDQLPVNAAERKLQGLLKAAGFPDGARGQQLKLHQSVGTTTPDILYRMDFHAEDEGVVVYLDGLSQGIHGNAATADRDRVIRDWLRNNGYEVVEITAVELDDPVAMQRYFRRLASLLRRDDVRNTVVTDTKWFDQSEPDDSPAPVLKIVRPSAGERYVRCVPLTTLKAAAGGFGEPQFLEELEAGDWVEVSGDTSLRAGMFAAKVVGRSMEPKIPDGATCLFAGPVTGSRAGRIVLAQLEDQKDPESGFRYTVKRYQSEKTTGEDGAWRHVRVSLEPINPDFATLELAVDAEERVRVIAEFVRVVG